MTDSAKRALGRKVQKWYRKEGNGAKRPHPEARTGWHAHVLEVRGAL